MLPWKVHILAGTLMILAVQSLAGGSSSSAPAWLDRLPRSPDRYIGIGKADKAAHPTGYREAAQAAALAQIGREIAIRVRSESRSRVEDGPQGSEERFSQIVQGVSSAELTGYELLDQYETEDALWVYYALDKEMYLKGVEEAERKVAAGWAREAAGLEEELRSRRIQAAVGRWKRLRRQVPEGAGWPEPFESMTSRLRGALGRTGLKMEPPVWVLYAGDSLARGTRGPSGNARAHLVGNEGGFRWKGPITLVITGRGSPRDSACKVETGMDGEVDLLDFFQACGMKPGTWKVEWEGPDGMRLQGEVKARVVKTEWALSVRATGGTVGADWAEDLEGELASRENLFFRWSAKTVDRPAVEIGLREALVDSLEGIYFTALRGTARIPGARSPLDVQGKAGHSNRAASRVRAIRDLAEDVMRSMEAP